jgi:hypothetical protein
MQTNFHEIENESLPAHVSICQERYLALGHRLQQVEQRLDSVDVQLQAIMSMINQVHQDQQAQWTQARNWLIGTLLSIVATLGSIVFLSQ